MATGDGDDPDVAIAGVSLELAFDGRLWFELWWFTMPGYEYGKESQNTLGLAWRLDIHSRHNYSYV